MNIDEMLKEARRRFPKDKEFKSMTSNQTRISTGQTRLLSSSPLAIGMYIEDNPEGYASATVYKDNIWTDDRTINNYNLY